MVVGRFRAAHHHNDVERFRGWQGLADGNDVQIETLLTKELGQAAGDIRIGVNNCNGARRLHKKPLIGTQYL